MKMTILLENLTRLNVIVMISKNWGAMPHNYILINEVLHKANVKKHDYIKFLCFFNAFFVCRHSYFPLSIFNLNTIDFNEINPKQQPCEKSFLSDIIENELVVFKSLYKDLRDTSIFVDDEGNVLYKKLCDRYVSDSSVVDRVVDDAIAEELEFIKISEVLGDSANVN